MKEMGREVETKKVEGGEGGGENEGGEHNTKIFALMKIKGKDSRVLFFS